MFKVHNIMEIRLSAGEVIVALTSHHGCLYAITNGGTVYLIEGPF